ncbi:DUF2169 domain-containing protein [Amaricoccus sp.]|uniref:DUF2169 family type VI secretion system accessory protein n=1 Tax=Amaricoccus sp. TaxID=1872485 RepID=UPI001B64D84B|nr:DUF2169 domain-containing protein [Amaricoccus sp.]MBP7000319.1 DUF2169 domain-containing protein [Amaricoccus sp.]
MAFAVWLENRTPFAADTHVQVDAEGQEVLVLMLSASFEAGAEGLRPAAEQTPVAFADVPSGDPALSSTRYEADIAPVKPAVDVIVNGCAHAPGGRAAAEVQVGIRVGTVRKVLSVVGDRARAAGGYSAARPFTAMPVVWERAWGGTAEDGQCEVRNPVGIGFKGARSADPGVLSEAPNVLYPGEAGAGPGDRPRPAGLGVVGRGWRPRIGYAGTYDQAWIDGQWPLPPKDFDPRHHLAAPEDQQAPALPPGTVATLVNLTPEGRWEFRLPRIAAPVRLIYDDRVEETAFEPDTVLIEPELKRVTLKARRAFVTRRNAPALREIAFGHVSPVWLNARRKRKAYLNPLGGDGTLTDRPTWAP